MIRKAVLMVLVAGLAASAVGAADIGMYVADLGTYGWNTVVVPDSAGRGSVTDRLWGTEPCMQFTNGNKDLAPGTNWATISTANHAGVAASAITSLKIRSYGIEGDGSDYQAPMFMLAFCKAPDNVSNRWAWWIPWADDTPRTPGAWTEYDAMTDGQWYVPNTGGRYATYAALLAALPTAVLAADAQMGTIPTGAHSFNVGFATYWKTELGAYGDSARGVVDWFEVGINGVATKYYLSDVPEPATIGMLLLGLPLLLRRRR